MTPESRAQAKRRIAAWLSERFFVRFHFSLILGVAFAVGLLATKSFLALGMETLHWRWPLALLLSYLTFLLCVRLWLGYIGLGRYIDDGKDVSLDLPDVSFSGGSGSSGGGVSLDVGNLAVRAPGGGEFGGAGASGDFSLSVGDSGSGSGGVLSSLGDAVGEVGGGSSDEGCLVVLAILVLFAVILAAGGFMIWQAPNLLAEAAFEAALAAGLVKPLRRIADPGWVGGALRASAWPFALIFVCAMAIAGLAEHYAPAATTLPEAIRILLA